LRRKTSPTSDNEERGEKDGRSNPKSRSAHCPSGLSRIKGFLFVEQREGRRTLGIRGGGKEKREEKSRRSADCSSSAENSRLPTFQKRGAQQCPSPRERRIRNPCDRKLCAQLDIKPTLAGSSSVLWASREECVRSKRERGNVRRNKTATPVSRWCDRIHGGSLP